MNDGNGRPSGLLEQDPSAIGQPRAEASRDEGFDRIARLVAGLLDVPVALVSLVDPRGERPEDDLPGEWRVTERLSAARPFCQQVMKGGAPLVIEDARRDFRVRDGALTDDPSVVAYAGVPLRSSTGVLLGCLSVTDSRPRAWTRDELARLGDVAALATAEVERRDEAAARRRVEGLLRRGEAQFQSILETANEGIWFVDLEGRTIYVNQRLCGLLATSVLALLGRTLVDYCVPEDAASARDRFRRVLTGEAERFELRLRRADGSTRWTLVSANPTRDGEGRITGALCLFTDQTREREAEAGLRENEQRYCGLVNAIDATVWRADVAGGRTFSSDQWTLLTGQSGDLARGSGWIGPVHPDDRERVSDRWRTAVATGEPYQDEFRTVGSDGRVRTVRSRALPVRASDGAIREWIGVMSEFVGGGSRGHGGLSQGGDRTKDEFLSMLAHELRNPLAPIRNSVEILRLVRPTDPSLDRAREVIDRQVAHLARLVDDLVDASRLAHGKIALRRDLVDLSALIEEAVEKTRPEVESRGHGLTVELPPEPVVLDADRARIVQVLSNLLGNAAKFTEPGGRIGISVETADKDVAIRVSDSGVGIAPELLPHVFETFTQAETTPDRGLGGLGVGLSLAKGLIELHDGTVEAWSGGSHQGSEFVVRLPRARRPVTSSASSEMTSMATDKHRILVVDDSTDGRQSMAELLRLAGHEVSEAPDGPTALRVASEFRPHVVLLDIGLPGMDGFEVASRLRELPETRHAVLIALTGYGHSEIVNRSKEAGFNHHLVKPMHPHALDSLLPPLA